MNLWQKLSLAQVRGAAGRLPGYRARQGGGCASRISGAFLISATPFLCVNAGVFPFVSVEASVFRNPPAATMNHSPGDAAVGAHPKGVGWWLFTMSGSPACWDWLCQQHSPCQQMSAGRGTARLPVQCCLQKGLFQRQLTARGGWSPISPVLGLSGSDAGGCDGSWLGLQPRAGETCVPAENTPISVN